MAVRMGVAFVVATAFLLGTGILFVAGRGAVTGGVEAAFLWHSLRYPLVWLVVAIAAPVAHVALPGSLESAPLLLVGALPVGAPTRGSRSNV